MGERKTKPFTIPALLEWIDGLRYFYPDEACEGRIAIPKIIRPSESDSRLVLVLGENAGGKSFFRRLVWAGTSSKHKGPLPVDEVIHLSMQARAGGMGAMGAFVYGSESWQSTGENSAHTVAGGITTAKGRDHGVILYWDEPDIGMSESSAAGAALDLVDFLREAPEHVKAVFITTHSKAMVEKLLPLDPWYVHLGDSDGPRSIGEWLVRKPVPIRPAELKALSRRRFLDIQAILNSGKRKK